MTYDCSSSSHWFTAADRVSESGNFGGFEEGSNLESVSVGPL